MRKLSHLDEFGFINSLHRYTKGIGDDTAIVSMNPNKQLLLTADMLVEDVHFTIKMPAMAIGHKALACSISDIAAMGGVPKYGLISLGAPKKTSVNFIHQIYKGMYSLAEKFGIQIVGGDTVKSSKLIINVALTGEGKRSELVFRNGAKKGHSIFVTGPLGNSFQSDWHLRFLPRVKESRYLVKKYKLSAMIDISDGLAADLGHILEESKKGAVLYENRIPKRKKADIKNALYDGEDFELIFTLSRQESKKLESLKNKSFNFYQIGEIVDQSQGLHLVSEDGKKHKLKLKGYQHF